MKPIDILVEVARDVLGTAPDDDEALALMIVLHHHRMRLAGGEVRALTQRSAAGVVADAWPDRTDPLRTDYLHWYARFAAPTEIIDHEHMVHRVLATPPVLVIEPED